jgi:hypothetical protein
MDYWIMDYWIMDHWIMDYWIVDYWIIGLWIIGLWVIGLLDYWIMDYCIMDYWIMDYGLLDYGLYGLWIIGLHYILVPPKNFSTSSLFVWGLAKERALALEAARCCLGLCLCLCGSFGLGLVDYAARFCQKLFEGLVICRHFDTSHINWRPAQQVKICKCINHAVDTCNDTWDWVCIPTCKN